MDKAKETWVRKMFEARHNNLNLKRAPRGGYASPYTETLWKQHVWSCDIALMAAKAERDEEVKELAHALDFIVNGEGTNFGGQLLEEGEAVARAALAKVEAKLLPEPDPAAVLEELLQLKQYNTNPNGKGNFRTVNLPVELLRRARIAVEATKEKKK